MISLSVSWATPVPGVSVVVPIAGITYTFPIMDVLLDVRGLHARYTDAVQLSDSYVFLVEKGVNDATWFSDDHFYSASLGKLEIIQFQDTFFLNGNSYCEASYFAEDYAGVIRQV